jgi:hypothetical protein
VYRWELDGPAADLILVSRAGELLDIHPQDLRETHQHTVAVDTALPSLDLG